MPNSTSFNKKIITQNFSKAATTYDKSASIQQLAAKKLIGLVSPFIKDNSKILDLGSGTSFLGKEINNISDKNFTFYEVDLSREMLDLWQNRPDNYFAIQGDIENLTFPPASFDIIISSFSLQWIKDFPKVFSQIFSLLKPQGVFAFCLPTYESLSELKLASSESKCNFHFNDLPKNNELKLILKNAGFKEKIFQSEILSEEFIDGISALKSFKETGANYHNYSQKQAITKTKLKQFNSFYLKNSVTPNKNPAVSWHNSYFISHS